LIFGAGQVVGGGIVARSSFHRGIWKHARAFLLVVVSLWFICSGFLELLISGLEFARRLGSGLSVDTFDLWRARADNLLVWISILLLSCLLAYSIIRRLHSGP
jgi:hypothetical protein